MNIGTIASMLEVDINAQPGGELTWKTPHSHYIYGFSRTHNAVTCPYGIVCSPLGRRTLVAGSAKDLAKTGGSINLSLDPKTASA